MNRRILRLLTIAFFSSVLYACTDDYFDFDEITTDEWRPELAVPIVNSTLDLEDILIKEDTGEIITTDPNTGVLEIVYEGSVFAAVGGDFVDLPSQTLSDRLNGIIIPPGSPTIQVDSSFEFSFNTSVEIDSVLLKSGVLDLDIESSYQHSIDLRFEFPTVVNQFNQPLIIFQNLAASDGVNRSRANEVRFLSGYNVDMTKDGSTVNTIPVEVRMIINPINGNPSLPSDEMRFTARIRDLDFERFGGYIGQQSYQLDLDTINVNLFKNFKAGVFFVSNPTLEIDIKNSFGIPANLEFQKLDALNPDNQSSKILGVDLPIDPITNQKNLRRLKSPQKYELVNTDIDLNNTNSNIAQVISFLLKQIVYETRAEFNPEGKTVRNYLTDTSGIGLDVFLKIPFEGRVQRFFLIDTIDLNFEMAEDIEKGMVRIIADNSFPLDAKLQMYFQDSLNNTIDSLYIDGAQSAIPAADVDANGDAIGSKRVITDTEIDRQRLNRLEEGRFAVIVAELNTTNSSQGQNVRFKANHRLEIAVGLKAGILLD
ncbi:MAG: hypothetical protein CMP59_11360 [Flavobacteriales bacterium]|nr:hypothetical protein [Flavobacteriales bacterium]